MRPGGRNLVLRRDAAASRATQDRPGGFLPNLSRAALLLVALTYGLLVFGASVRVHGAGLACPDWPLCFGEVVPQIDFRVGLEFGHRVVAGAISLGFLALGGVVVARRREVGTAPVVFVVLAGVALAVQIVLGGLTVLHLLAEWTVTSHLLTGNTFCLLLLLLALSLRESGRVRIDGASMRAPVGLGQRSVAVAVAAMVPVQLALGGLVASTYAGLACGTWPSCDGTSWFPTFAGPVGLQVTHRLVAYLLLATVVAGAFLARGRGPAGRAALVTACAVGVQAVIGAANVLLHLPVELTLLHTAGAAAVVLSATWWNWEVWLAPGHRVAAHGPAMPVIETPSMLEAR